MLRVHRVKAEGPGLSSMSPDREQTKEERDCGSEGSGKAKVVRLK